MMTFIRKYTGRSGGFTLIETLIVVLISSVLMVVVMNVFIKYVNTSSQQSAQDSINSEVSSILKIIGRDVMMAGYGLPSSTKVASLYNYSGVDTAFGVNQTDKLFVADGWQILKAITSNNEVDGQIVATPTNYMTFLANKKSSSTGGYCTQLNADILTGTNAITLLNLNINAGEEYTVSAVDFIAGSALVISDGTKVEGHTISTVTLPNTVLTMPTDPVVNSYASATTNYVVPATVWYVRSDPDGKTFPDGTPVNWLYRNGYKVLPNVSGFRVSYGYDANNDGLQWSNTVPPTSTDIVGGVDGNASFTFSYLKEIKITLTVKSVYKSDVRSTSYQSVILLRN